MSRLINDELLKESIREKTLFVKWQKVLIEMVIDDQPTVEAVPVVHGKWERVKMWTGAETIFCSVCGEDCYASDTGDDILSDYCPNCGARMDVHEIES